MRDTERSNDFDSCECGLVSLGQLTAGFYVSITAIVINWAQAQKKCTLLGLRLGHFYVFFGTEYEYIF